MSDRPARLRTRLPGGLTLREIDGRQVVVRGTALLPGAARDGRVGGTLAGALPDRGLTVMHGPASNADPANLPPHCW